MVSFDSATREQDYLAESECLWRESEHVGGVWGRGRGLRNAMHVWEVGLAGFEINDLDTFSGCESSQRKQRRRGRDRRDEEKESFLSPKKNGTERKSFREGAHA